MIVTSTLFRCLISGHYSMIALIEFFAACDTTCVIVQFVLEMTLNVWAVPLASRLITVLSMLRVGSPAVWVITHEPV